jgi:hypothetical protein
MRQMNMEQQSKIQMEFNQLQLFRPKQFSKSSPNYHLWSNELCNCLKEDCDITVTFEEKQKTVCGYHFDGIMLFLHLYDSVSGK